MSTRRKPPVPSSPPRLELAKVPSTVDLLRLPYTFTQQALLTEMQFRREAKKRGVRMQREQLEQLHRRRLVGPFVRIHSRPVGPPVNVDGDEEWGAGWQERLAALKGRLGDPATRPFRPWPRDDGYRYSYFQLIALHTFHKLVEQMPAKRAPDGIAWDLPKPEPYVVGYGDHYRALAIAAEILAPRYHPRVRRNIRYNGNQFDGINALVNDHDPVAEETALATGADALLGEAEMLLFEASRIDPLGKWGRLVRIGNSSRWDDLRFDALIAHEKRIVAEMLLMHVEDLAEQGRAAALPALAGNLRQARHDRLTVDPEERSEALLDFGMHDRPALVLAVEGDTEALLVPRVLQLFGIEEAAGLIQVVNLKSIDGDVRILARAVAVPRLTDEDHGPRVRSTVTALMVAVDPEKKYRTARQQADKQRDMVNEVHSSLSRDLRTVKVRTALEHCIRVRTWGTHSFEYAHFTTHELATAIRRVGGKSAPPLADIKADLDAGYATNANIDKVWKPWDPKLSKVRLAEELWPKLERRILSAKGTLPPVAAVVDEAIGLAMDARRTRVFQTGP